MQWRDYPLACIPFFLVSWPDFLSHSDINQSGFPGVPLNWIMSRLPVGSRVLPIVNLLSRRLIYLGVVWGGIAGYFFQVSLSFDAPMLSLCLFSRYHYPFSHQKWSVLRIKKFFWTAKPWSNLFHGACSSFAESYHMSITFLWINVPHSFVSLGFHEISHKAHLYCSRGHSCIVW